MRDLYRWGLATGFAAALALFGNAQAQTPGSSTAEDRASSRSTESQGPGQSGTPATPETSRSATSEQSAQKSQVKKSLAEQLQKLHAGNQAEVELGKLGEQNAQSADVKEYARMMASDHQQLDEKLTQAAQSLGVDLKGKEFQKAQKDAQKDMEKMTKKTGADFDKEYMSAMVKDHKKDIKNVEKAAKEARDGNHQELASLLEQAQRGMSAHLQQAQSIEETLGKTQRQGRRGSTPGRAEPSSPDTGSTGTGTGTGTQQESDYGRGPSGSDTSNPPAPPAQGNTGGKG